MADVKEEVQQESTEVESSPAESNTESLRNLSSEEYKEWRTTGKLPEKPATKETKTSKEAKPSDSKTSVKKEGEPETPEEDEEEEEETPRTSKKQSRSEARKAELNEEIRTLATKRQEEEQALNLILEKKKKAAEPENKESEEKPKSLDIKALVAKVKARADKGEFASYEEAVAATAEALIDEKGVGSEARLQKMLAEAMTKFREEFVKEQKEEQTKSTVEAQRKAQETEWVKKVTDAEKDHPDFKEVCFTKDSPAAKIKAGSPLDRAIMKSPQGALLLYHVCNIEGEVERLNQLDPDLDQPAEIKAIIQKLSGKKPEEEETPHHPTTRAKKPPSEAPGRTSANADASETALKNKDYTGYAAAENAKELARRKAALGKS